MDAYLSTHTLRSLLNFPRLLRLAAGAEHWGKVGTLTPPLEALPALERDTRTQPIATVSAEPWLQGHRLLTAGGQRVGVRAGPTGQDRGEPRALPPPSAAIIFCLRWSVLQT